jgi:hypothetical protein
LPGFSSVVGGFFAKLWKRTERPVLIILEHVIVTVASLFGIWIIEYILKVLGLSENPNAHVFFDPSKIDLSFKDDKTVCVKSLSLTANGIPQTSFENICFGGGGNIIRLMSIQHAVELDAEPLATSSRGVAWVLGLRGL